MTALVSSTRAELLRLRLWPALWVMLGIWVLLNLTFGYVFPYLSYRTGGGGFSNEGVPVADLLAQILPGNVPAAVIGGIPMFGGAIMLTLGALAAGGGYGWGTWKTTFIQGRGRIAAVGGNLVALVGFAIALVLATFLVDLGVAAALAAVEGQSLALPPVGEIAGGLAGAVLIAAMWTLAGAAIGALTRSPALAVGLGVVWVLAVENLLRGTASLLDWLRPVTDVLPGTVAGSVAAAVGATPVSEGGPPGVVTNLDAAPAVILAAGYLVVFALLMVFTMRRQDIT
ncbi:MAG TPA: ABC transporter permease [Actinophytocola sp.]|uniref:ABC transporter permease n=1 Tax=Actinophytocola sp. TaxID=1872138 RepID=UPI002DDCB822|nr:ABC transporter permease [Actinophytocola sp.]HEV2781663.1 ABC transporter permease [Actinophytocola sp.]